jgi:hypothetical protein
MEKLEKLFQRKHNQLNGDEMNAVNAYRKIIASRITHVIDCEAYSNSAKKIFLREVSVYHVKTHECSSFQIIMPFVLFNEKQYSIRYQIKNIHGLPMVKERLTNDFFTLEEAMTFLTKEFTSNADLVAYKGGDIERNLLNNMGVRCINLEVLTCPKYVDLLTKYGYQQECCPYHVAQSYHCSRHEVKVFTQFIEELIV